MRRGIIILAAMISLVVGSTSSPAAVSYTAGSADVAQGNFSVAITVSSDLAEPVNYWGNAGFNLVWDQNVLELQPTLVSVTGSPLPISPGNFFSPNGGQLNFTWTWLENDPEGWQVANGSTLFTVNFTAIGDVGDSTALSFTSVANIGLTDVNGGNFTPILPTSLDGLIQVVPEPVDYALGVFGMIVLGTSGVRWFSCRRKPLHPLS